MRYKKGNRKSSDVLLNSLAYRKATVKRDGFEVRRGYADGRTVAQPTTDLGHASYGRSASYYGPFYARRYRMLVVRNEEKDSLRVFEFNGMRFEVHTREKGELDLQHIKVIIPDNPSRNAEVIHQFSVLNKVRRRQLGASDFPAAYEREVVDRYMQLQPDERDVVFNLLNAEYNAL